MDRNRYWILNTLAIVSLVLVLVNIVLYDRNRGLQADVSNRNLYIQKSLQLEGIYQPLLRTLADLSVRYDDAQLRALLAKQGITVNVTTPPAQAPAPPAQAPAPPTELPAAPAEVTKKESKKP